MEGLKLSFAGIDAAKFGHLNFLGAVGDHPAGQLQILEGASVVSVCAECSLAERVSDDLADAKRAAPPQ